MTREELLAKWSQKVDVLNGQGFVRVVDAMGGDGSVVTAARVSTGRGRSAHEWDRSGLDALGRYGCKVCGKREPLDTEAPGLSDEIAEARALGNLGSDVAGPVCVEGDRRLIRYMMAHDHGTPFEFASVTFHVRVPMDVWRQWVRHRTFAINEYSTRYSTAIDDALTTPPDAWRAQATVNRQGSAGMVTEWPEGYRVERHRAGVDVCAPNGMGVAVGSENLAEVTPGTYLSRREALLHVEARSVYEERLAFGVAREQARKDLPLSNFTEAYWTGNLRNLLHFLYLRTDSHAQQEIREYASVIAAFVSEWCPLTWGAFVEHRRDAVTFSATQARVVREMVAGWARDEQLRAESEGSDGTTEADHVLLLAEKLGLRKREVGSLLAKLGLEEP